MLSASAFLFLQVWQTFLAKGAGGLLVLTPYVDAQTLEEVFQTFDVQNAQATQPEDRERILNAIESSIGAMDLNLQLKQALVESAVYEADNAPQPDLAQQKGRPVDRNQWAAADKAAALLFANGQYVEAGNRRGAILKARQAGVYNDFKICLCGNACCLSTTKPK